jgi:hypothetical protein
LIAGAMATETLLAWCEEHGLSQGPITVECQQRLALSAVPDEVRATLGPAAHEAVHYRQVRLMRGSLALATAENWFVPQRLTADMNETLNQTEIPFGTVIAPLRPFRRTLAAHLQPLAADPAEDLLRARGSAHQPRPEIILEHIAVILSGSRTALAFVKESFFSELVSFALAPSSWPRALDGRPEGPGMRHVRLER